jgi:subtilisin family serine protease
VRRHAPRVAFLVASLCLACAAATEPGAGVLDTSSDSLIHADASRALGFTGKGVTVAVLDTGIDDHNPDLAAAVTAEHCIVPPDGCPDGSAEQDGPGSAQDDQGHGTAIADIIAGNGKASPVGVAPDASLVVVKVADANGRTSTAQIVAGLNWVLVHHPEAEVVNVSLGSDILWSGDCSNLNASLTAYATVIGALRAHGATVFASSGNRGFPYSMTSPACIHAAVAVGAVYSRSFGPFTAPDVCRDPTTAPDQIACFSDSSTELDLLAVGAPIDAAGLGSDDSLLAGTSAAAAQAAGAAAALLQADPALTPDGLVSLLESTGVPITDRRNHLTASRIDLAAALGALLVRPVPLPPPPAAVGPPSTPILSAPTVPSASLSTKPISFGSVPLSRAVTRALVIRNSGTGHLTVRVATSLASVSARPARLSIAASARGTVLLTFRPLRAGVYRGKLRLGTDDPAAPSITVVVRGTGRGQTSSR